MKIKFIKLLFINTAVMLFVGCESILLPLNVIKLELPLYSSIDDLKNFTKYKKSFTKIGELNVVYSILVSNYKKCYLVESNFDDINKIGTITQKIDYPNGLRTEYLFHVEIYEMNHSIRIDLYTTATREGRLKYFDYINKGVLICNYSDYQNFKKFGFFRTN